MPSRWYATDARSNVASLEAEYGTIFDAMAELDRTGHAVLQAVLDNYRGHPWETVVGCGLLRRSITQYEGVRYLLEHSAVQASALTARALFETLLAVRYLLFGAQRYVTWRTKSTPRGREVRARYYRAEELRRQIYRRQAALDGRLGTWSGIPVDPKDIQDEIDDILTELRQEFPRQHRRFGDLLCFPRAKGRISYHDIHTWYSLGFRRSGRDAVRTVRSLARRFGWERDYEVLYDAFSGFAHVRGLAHDIVLHPEGASVRVPHTPEDFETIAFFACSWEQLILSYFARTYAPAALQLVQQLDLKIRPVLNALRGSVPTGFA